MAIGKTDGAWLRVGVMGAGGIGCYVAGMLAGAGAPVTVIARPRHATAIARDGLQVESGGVPERIHMTASVDASALADADVVLVSVKSVDTAEAGRQMAPHLRPDALVISLQNGMGNVERLRAQVRNTVCPAVVYIAAEMAGPGHVRHNGGNTIVAGLDEGVSEAGGRARAAKELARAIATLRRAGIDGRVSDDVRAELWAKLASNCSYNAISALARATCGRAAADARVHDVMRRVIEEVVIVAAADGVTLDMEATATAIFRVGEVMTNAVASTYQDLEAGRRTEIDDINGFVVRRANARGIDTPVNATLYAVLKLLEAGVGLERRQQG